MRKLDNYDAYILAEDIDTPFISLLSDGDFAGAKVTSSTTREYETDYAAHILGTVGLIQAEDWAELKDKGYDMDDWIGRDGVELAFEQYLKGTDGRRVVSTNANGKITGEYYSEEPEPGNTVELTIDLKLQQAVEDLLAETVSKMNEEDGDYAPRRRRCSGKGRHRRDSGPGLLPHLQPLHLPPGFQHSGQRGTQSRPSPGQSRYPGRLCPGLHPQAPDGCGRPGRGRHHHHGENQGYRQVVLSRLSPELHLLLEPQRPRLDERHLRHYQLL